MLEYERGFAPLLVDDEGAVIAACLMVCEVDSVASMLAGTKVLRL